MRATEDTDGFYPREVGIHGGKRHHEVRVAQARLE
jgi:hypothetical protein